MPLRFPHGRAGFTIIELLVVAAIVILLLGLLIVAVNIATRASQKARTQALMNSMKQSLIRFKEDMGYYPPMLGPDGGGLRDMFPPPNMAAPMATYANYMQDWFSTCTIADYLIGYGSHREDGYGRVPGVTGPASWNGETPPVGIRSPGDDGVWGAMTSGTATGLLADRMLYGQTTWGADNQNPMYPWDQGKVFGPYLELKDERLLAGINYGSGGTLEVYFPGDALPGTLSWETIPKAIVDYWGMPIRYYRKPYPAGSIKNSYRPNTDINRDGVIDAADRVPTLSDVYVLRPWSIKPGSEVTNPLPADPAGGNQSTRELDTAEFALLSFGPDKQIDQTTANDELTDGDGDARFAENQDNLAEIGP